MFKTKQRKHTLGLPYLKQNVGLGSSFKLGLIKTKKKKKNFG